MRRDMKSLVVSAKKARVWWPRVPMSFDFEKGNWMAPGAAVLDSRGS